MYDDEYYCPNCGAVLNDQDGFDPDGSVWTCTECGETLYGGDMESTMENYNGVVWYCDSCNAILNKQSGFDDSLPYWDCTECGHRNEISEDQIYESQEDYENSKKQYTCPNCEANLNDQYLFDEDSEYTCDDCRSELYKNGDEYEILYRCPSCNSILNEQYSFDADAEYTCSRCNIDLYKNGNEYEVLYKCPECHAVLNEQSSFNEDDEYTCSSCSTNLYKSNGEYKVAYHCPECGSLLNEQITFYEFSSEHKCEECDTELYKNGDKYEVLYRCPKCNAILNDQYSFNCDNKYCCSNCRTDLVLENDVYEVKQDSSDDNEDYYEEDSYETNDNDYVDESDDDDYTDDSDAEESYVYESDDNDVEEVEESDDDDYEEEYEEEYEESDDNKSVHISFKAILISIVLLCVMGAIGYGIYEVKQLIIVDYSSYELIGENYEDVERKLDHNGFTDIETRCYRNLEYNQRDLENRVDFIKIGTRSRFTKGDKLRFNAPVVIEYRLLKEECMPSTSKEFKGKNYKKVKKKLQEAGFKKVKIIYKKDLITGWIKKENTVDSVSVNDDFKYDIDTSYRIDADIKIYVHSFKK